MCPTVLLGVGVGPLALERPADERACAFLGLRVDALLHLERLLDSAGKREVIAIPRALSRWLFVELLDLRHVARPFRRIDDVLLHDRPDPIRGRIDVDFLSQSRHPAIINRVSDAGIPARPARSRGLGALRHRNYRLFVSGQIISTVGTWMQSVAMPWLSLELTHSGLLVGLVLATQFTPVLLGSQFGGIVADRYHKRNVLLTTQSLFTLPSFALFALSATGHAQYWMVLVAAAATGTINLFDVPARQAFVIEMVGRHGLINAIALNSSVFNAAAVIGPSIAGLIIGAVGVPLCFLANSVSYLAAVGAVLMMKDLPAIATQRPTPPLLARIAQGASYARHGPVIGMLLVAVAVFSLFAMNRLTLIPLFADQVLHVGARGFGFLMGAMGLGALFGALTLAYSSSLAANPAAVLDGLDLGGGAARLFGVEGLWAVAGRPVRRGLLPDLVRGHRQQPHPDHRAGQ